MNLFDYTQRGIEDQANAYAKMSDKEATRAMLYKAGAGIAGGIKGMLGVEDPDMKKASEIKLMTQGLDLTTAKGLKELAIKLGEKGYNQEGAMAAQRANMLAKQEAELGKATSDASKAALSLQQEEKLRAELSALPKDATEEDFLGVVRKYGKPDEVMKAMETRLAKQQASADKLEAAKLRIEADLQRARENNASKETIAKMMLEGKKELASIAAAIKQSTKEDKPLSSQLQAREDADLEKINSLEAQATALEPAIKAVTKDSTGKAPLELGPINNQMYAVANATGKSTPASKAYAELQRAVQAATNLKVSAEKGVQTDKDVLRFANELTAAFGANDTEVTLQALSNFNKAVKTAKDKTKNILQSRRKSQNVGEYKFEETPKKTETRKTKGGIEYTVETD